MEQPQKTRRGGSKPGRKITRLPLSTLNGLIVEAGRVYRRMKDGKMDHEHGRSLVWVLGQLRAMLEAQHLERMWITVRASERLRAEIGDAPAS